MGLPATIMATGGLIAWVAETRQPTTPPTTNSICGTSLLGLGPSQTCGGRWQTNGVFVLAKHGVSTRQICNRRRQCGTTSLRHCHHMIRMADKPQYTTGTCCTTTQDRGLPTFRYRSNPLLSHCGIEVSHHLRQLSVCRVLRIIRQPFARRMANQ